MTLPLCRTCGTATYLRANGLWAHATWPPMHAHTADPEPTSGFVSHLAHPEELHGRELHGQLPEHLHTLDEVRTSGRRVRRDFGDDPSYTFEVSIESDDEEVVQAEFERFREHPNELREVAYLSLFGEAPPDTVELEALKTLLDASDSAIVQLVLKRHRAAEALKVIISGAPALGIGVESLEYVLHILESEGGESDDRSDEAGTPQVHG